MAQWALQFTPCVTTHGQHHTLLLEVAASLRLWGGNTALLNRLSQSWRDFGWQPPDTVTMACAPTARHAQWLALYGAELSCPPELMPLAVSDTVSAASNSVSDTSSLSTLPVSCIEELQPHLDVLARMGIRTIGQLNGLPRGGMTRRFGKQILHILDQAYGKVPDTHLWIKSAEYFSVRRELLARADNTALIEQAASRCLHELSAWLIARQLGAKEITLTLHHDNPPPTPLALRFASPTRDITRFQRLLSERLARFQVNQPVYEIELHANTTESLAHTTQDFLGGGASEKEDLQILIERLEARLGQAQVQRLCVLDEHRPEQSVALQAIAEQPSESKTPHSRQFAQPLSAVRPSNSLPSAPLTSTLLAQEPLHLKSHRPSWLLNPPLQLTIHQHRPHYQGPLQLLCGPERIEAGWWDDRPDGPTQRDYFIARTTQESIVWIFRTPAHSWYLHGFFS